MSLIARLRLVSGLEAKERRQEHAERACAMTGIGFDLICLGEFMASSRRAGRRDIVAEYPASATEPASLSWPNRLFDREVIEIPLVGWLTPPRGAWAERRTDYRRLDSRDLLLALTNGVSSATAAQNPAENPSSHRSCRPAPCRRRRTRETNERRNQPPARQV